MQASKAEFYNDKVVRQFTVMTVVWGIVGMTGRRAASPRSCTGRR